MDTNTAMALCFFLGYLVALVFGFAWVINMGKGKRK